MRIRFLIRMSEFVFPPAKDLLVVGRKAPVGSNALERALKLLSPYKFEKFEIEDDVIGCFFAKHSDIKKIGKERMVEIVLRNVKPRMEPEDIVRCELTVEVELEDEIEC